MDILHAEGAWLRLGVDARHRVFRRQRLDLVPYPGFDGGVPDVGQGLDNQTAKDPGRLCPEAATRDGRRAQAHSAGGPGGKRVERYRVPVDHHVTAPRASSAWRPVIPDGVRSTSTM